MPYGKYAGSPSVLPTAGMQARNISQRISGGNHLNAGIISLAGNNEK
jgi:hypothetical protein